MEASTQYFAASYQWALSGMRPSASLDTCARWKVPPDGSALLVIHPIKTLCVATAKKGRLAMLQMSLFSSLPRLRGRSYGARDSRSVAGVDHA